MSPKRLFTFLWLSCCAAQSAVIVQIRVVEGEGLVHQLGSRAKIPLTVLVTDENGNPVDGATVSFRLPESGPGGVFSGGLKTELATTHADGKASVWGIQWNKTPGPFEIRITAIREQARAGIVSAQFLGEAAQPSAPGPVQSGGTGTFSKPHGSYKWLYIVAVAAAGAGGAGLALGHSSKSSPTTSLTPPTTIGNPSISIGPPK